MANIKNFDPSLLEINKLSGKSTSINIYFIEYMTMKSLDHVNIDSENPLYLTFNNADGYIIGKRNGDKVLLLQTRRKKKYWRNASEGIVINKPNKSKECVICHYWHFKDLSNFQIVNLSKITIYL